MTSHPIVSAVFAVVAILIGFSFFSRFGSHMWPSFCKVLDLREVFPTKPVIVREGTVKKRQVKYQAAIASSAMRNIRAPQIPFYQFYIDCHDHLGTDVVIVLVEKDAENELALEGCRVKVTSQQSRFDFGYCHRSVVLLCGEVV